MAQGFNTAAGLFFGIGSSLIWFFLGYPAKCADDPTGQKIPAITDVLGQECEKQTVLGLAPIVASKEGALVLAVVIGAVCFVLAGILGSSSSSSR